MQPHGRATPDAPRADDALTRHNVTAESFFSAFNGIYMGLAIFAAPVVAVTGVQANPLELTLLVSAFPVGAFLGPLWAGLGRRWGMKRLVTQMAVWANVPMLLLHWVRDPWLFTILFSTLLLDVLLDLRDGQPIRRHRLLPLMFALWANLHVQF